MVSKNEKKLPADLIGFTWKSSCNNFCNFNSDRNDVQSWKQKSLLHFQCVSQLRAHLLAKALKMTILEQALEQMRSGSSVCALTGMGC